MHSSHLGLAPDVSCNFEVVTHPLWPFAAMAVKREASPLSTPSPLPSLHLPQTELAGEQSRAKVGMGCLALA